MHFNLEFANLDQAPYEGLIVGLADTPVGPAVLAWDNLGLRELNLDNNPSSVLETWSTIGGLGRRDDSMAQRLASEVFLGHHLSLPLVLCGTAFQREVWRELLKLRVGETVSYGELANRLGKAGAARAVGSAVGSNRLGFVVPCHRVVRHDGVIGQFRWGTEVKASLLAWESRTAHG